MIKVSPFRRQISPSTYTKKARGTVPAYKHKLYNFLTIPDLSIACTWRGASEIIITLVLNDAVAMSFLDNVPSNPNYCAVIAWRIDSETIQRYKLWEDVGEILYEDLYAGQAIPSDAWIEIWNTKDETSIDIVGLTIKTLLLSIPTCSCDTVDRYTALSYTQCTDLQFLLTGFNPSVGDYYVVIGCGVTQIAHASVLSSLILKCYEDNTWHEFSLQTVAGLTYGLIDQANHAAGTKDYYPFIGIDGNVYPLRIILAAGIYSLTVDSAIIDSTATAFIQMLSTDANHYLLSLTPTLDGLYIDQNPIP